MCGNILGGGVKWTLNKSQHTKVTLEKKSLLALLPGFQLATFRYESGALGASYPGSQDKCGNGY